MNASATTSLLQAVKILCDIIYNLVFWLSCFFGRSKYLCCFRTTWVQGPVSQNIFKVIKAFFLQYNTPILYLIPKLPFSITRGHHSTLCWQNYLEKPLHALYSKTFSLFEFSDGIESGVECVCGCRQSVSMRMRWCVMRWCEKGNGTYLAF